MAGEDRPHPGLSPVKRYVTCLSPLGYHTAFGGTVEVKIR
jgi:hypothetical protein